MTIQGYRQWNCTPNKLLSWHPNSGLWPLRSPAQAVCDGMSPSGSQAPCPPYSHRGWSEDRYFNECGLYAYHALEALEHHYSNFLGQVFGICEAWGTVWPYDKGFRAQYMRPTGIFPGLPPARRTGAYNYNGEYSMLSQITQEQIYHIATQYEIEVLPLPQGWTLHKETEEQ